MKYYIGQLEGTAGLLQVRIMPAWVAAVIGRVTRRFPLSARQLGPIKSIRLCTLCGMAGAGIV